MAGCPELVSVGYCPDHASIVDRQWNRRGTAIYKTERWRGLRRQVLKDHPFCQVDGCHQMSTDVDHIVPIRDGGAPWDRANLQGLCAMHHSRKTASEVWGLKSTPRPATL